MNKTKRKALRLLKFAPANKNRIALVKNAAAVLIIIVLVKISEARSGAFPQKTKKLKANKKIIFAPAFALCNIEFPRR